MTLPQYQLPLIAILSVLVLRSALRRRPVSACMLGTVLVYSIYLLAIDMTGQIAQVRVFSTLPPDFIIANCVILGTFALCFLVGGWIVDRIAPTSVSEPKRDDGVLGPLLAGLVLVALSADGWWLFAPYPQNKGLFQVIPLGGAGAVANLLILIATNRARTSGWHKGLARAGFWLVVAHYGLAGDRGSLLFLLVGAYGFYLASLHRLGCQDVARAAILAGALLFVLEQISFLRAWGTQVPSASGTFLEEIDLLPQSVAHMFHAISIQLSGYQTFAGNTGAYLATLWLQIIPSGLLRAVGVEPYNGPLMLSDFVVHGGGFFVPAELYFAGGLPTLSLLATYFGGLAALADRLATRREDTVMMTLVLLVAASNFYTMFYGVQAVHRMLTLPVVLLVARSLLKGVLRHTRFRRAW